LIWKTAEVEDIELFRKKVRGEGYPLLQKLLTDKWFKQVAIDCQEVWDKKKEEHDHRYFPIRWLLEDGQWDFINSGLKVVDKITHKKSYLRTLVRDLMLDDWMLSETHALGLSVICKFAHDEVLVDIEPKISTNSGKRADALVNISGRTVLVEATRITKDLVSKKATIGSVSVSKMMYQTISKLKAKAEQLDEASQPTVVITTAAPRIGADSINAEWAVVENIHSFPKISAVIVSESHNFKYGGYNTNSEAEYKLSENEIAYFSNLLELPSILKKLRQKKEQ